MGFDFLRAGGVEDRVGARAIPAFGGGGWAAGDGGPNVAFPWAAKVFTAMLRSCVCAGANGAGGGFVRASLVRVAEAEAVATVGGGNS